MENIAIEIGKIGFNIFCNDGVFISKALKRYKYFRVDFPKNAVDLSIVINGKNMINKGPKLFRKNNDIYIDYRGSSAKMDIQRRKCMVEMNSGNIYIFDSILRILLSFLLVEKGGFLLHSSGLIKNKNGYAFCGPSGAGKSTIAKLSQNAKVLSDELLAIRKCKDSGWKVYGTPFFGEFAGGKSNYSAKLKKLFFLNKSDRLRESVLVDNKSAGSLLRNILFFSSEKNSVRKLLDISLDFISSGKCYKLDFPLDRSYMEYVK